jgi:HSP20 family protein
MNGSMFEDFRRMQDEIDQLLGRAYWPSGIRAVARGTWPAVNVGTTPEAVAVYLFAPGVDVSSLDISIQQNLLTVSGERKAPAAEGREYYRKERHDGAFHRLVTLPEDVDPDQVEAHYRDGVLVINVRRKETARPRSIKVN